MFGIRAHPPPPSLPHSQRSPAVCHLDSLGPWELRVLACGRSSSVRGCWSPRSHFLCVGSVQLYFRKSACARRSTASLVVFWTAVVVVALVVLFPQMIASLIAG